QEGSQPGQSLAVVRPKHPQQGDCVGEAQTQLRLCRRTPAQSRTQILVFALQCVEDDWSAGTPQCQLGLPAFSKVQKEQRMSALRSLELTAGHESLKGILADRLQ